MTDEHGFKKFKIFHNDSVETAFVRDHSMQDFLRQSSAKWIVTDTSSRLSKEDGDSSSSSAHIPRPPNLSSSIRQDDVSDFVRHSSSSDYLPERAENTLTHIDMWSPSPQDSRGASPKMEDAEEGHGAIQEDEVEFLFSKPAPIKQEYQGHIYIGNLEVTDFTTFVDPYPMAIDIHRIWKKKQRGPKNIQNLPIVINRTRWLLKSLDMLLRCRNQSYDVNPLRFCFSPSDTHMSEKKTPFVVVTDIVNAVPERYATSVPGVFVEIVHLPSGRFHENLADFALSQCSLYPERTREDWLSIIGSSDIFSLLMSNDEGQWLGMANVRVAVLQNDYPMLEITTIFVPDDMQERGYASMMIGALMHLVRDLKGGYIFAQAHEKVHFWKNSPMTLNVESALFFIQLACIMPYSIYSPCMPKCVFIPSGNRAV